MFAARLGRFCKLLPTSLALDPAVGPGKPGLTEGQEGNINGSLGPSCICTQASIQYPAPITTIVVPVQVGVDPFGEEPYSERMEPCQKPPVNFSWTCSAQ